MLQRACRETYVIPSIFKEEDPTYVISLSFFFKLTLVDVHIYKPVSFKLGMMIECTESTVIPVSMTLTFIQVHSCMKR